jgi:K+-transporting ATPase KdpF subunit
MSWENALGLIVSVVVLVYLVCALLAPERLG